MNACFLTLTDELVASGWLERDLQVTKTVQGTIERFIAAVRASHAPEKENQVVSDDHDPDSIARGPLAQEVDLDRSHDAGTLEHGLIVAQSGGSTAPYEATYQASNFQSFPGELVLPHVNITHTFNFMTQLPIPGSIGPSSPTFAQRLNLEAIRAGLRLVCSAEDRSLDFYRVFNHVLDFHARERLRRLLNRILDHNFHQLLQPPPESDVDGQGSGALPSAWLNASDVARYFRTIGIDLDGSQDIVTVQMHRGSLPARLLSVQGLPARDLVKVRRGGFEGSPHQQRSYDQAYLSSTPRHHFTSATRDVSSFGIFDKHLGYTAQSHDMLDISIDVSKLIYGKYLSSPARGECLADADLQRSCSGHVVSTNIRPSIEVLWMMRSLEP